ncbi:MAG: choice-of-anchor J domain-containing protein [Oceanipulchritudo sp.]
MKKIDRYLTTLGCLLGVGSSTLMGVQINEVRIDEPGATDSNEFAEFKGDPGESLDDLWYLVIGDHTAFGSDDGENIPDKRGGVVEFAVSLDGLTIPDDGIFLMTSVNMQIDVLGLEISDIDLLLTEMNFENSDNVTHMLVRGYTGIEVTNFADQYDDLAVDIDDNDDGVPNTDLPWTEVVDAVGIVAEPNDADPEEFTYGEALGFTDVGPDGSFAPGMVYRGSDDGVWNIGEFNLINEDGDGLFQGDEQNGPALDTPGSPNPASPEPVITPSILGFSPSTVEPGDTVTVSGQNFGGTTSVTVGGVEASFNVVDGDSLEIEVDEELADGPIVITTPAGVATSSSDLTIIGGGSTVLAFEDFEEDLGEFTAISVASDADWEHGTFGGNGFAEISGFGADEASDDWLVSPEVDLDAANEPTLTFTTARNFGGPELEILISSDYDGLNPANASWTPVEAPLSEGSYDLVSSGEIDLSAYVGETIHVAFRYTSTGTEGGDGAVYQLHEFLVQDTVQDASLLLFEDFEADLGEFAAISVASDADWEHGTFGGNGFAEISGFGADEASDDWLVSPEVDLTGASSPVLSFVTARNFDGPELEVLISSNYDGLNPADATWDPVEAPLSEGSYDLVSSGEIDLSAYAGETIHVAFRYTSTGTESGEGAVYQVHEVLITGGSSFTPGWVKDPVLSWVYEYTPEWAFSLTMGVINIEAFPWIYQVSFGYLYIPEATDIEAGSYIIVDGEWAWVQAGLDGWFVNLAGEWDNFLTPQE